MNVFSQRFNRLYYQKPPVQQNTSANIVRHQQVHPSTLITKHYVNRPENGNCSAQEPLIVRKAERITTLGPLALLPSSSFSRKAERITTLGPLALLPNSSLSKAIPLATLLGEVQRTFPNL
ncbi:hypothetical protein OIU79_030358 [Salix purpurea]|uniref:Uncharacterized protein n=1 Tax=Salix purpurea TaxID=77065 RepID=A0A9Q0ZRN3_SALPP|nr:hypothetical protein OIU79_030358 [Salix purpurea]